MAPGDYLVPRVHWTMRIVTPGAVLRPWTSDDVPSLVRHADNPRVAAGMRDAFPSPYTPDDACRFIALATSPGRNLLLAIEVDGEAVGGIGIHPLEDVCRRTAEIGYWLAEPYWSRGITTGAVRAIAPVAFEEMDIVRLQAGVFSSNTASMRVLERSGFAREAVHRHAITKHGALLDEVVYVRFAPDS